MHRVAYQTSYRYSNSCVIIIKQMFGKMTHFSQNGAIKILVFQHFFCKPIDRFLLALDSLVLSLNDC